LLRCDEFSAGRADCRPGRRPVHGPSGAAGRLPDGHRPYGHLLPGGWHRGAATAEAPRRV